MTRNRKPFRAFTVLAMTLGTLSATSAALASPAAPSPTPQEKQVGMYVAGFDPDVAKAHGYKIVTYANGDRQSVPIDPTSKLPKGPLLHRQAPADAASPHRPVTASAANTDYNEVWGNCGVSWIRVTQTGAHKVSIASGYRNLPASAFFWTWTVTLTDRNGTSHQSHSGPTSGTSASRTWSNLNQYGWTHDYVSAGGATLNDGTICFSGRPDVSISGL
ncbi:hypothetical protein [Couchioplanes azureus]|uniref:hypothetical protein n=1 Tax=Couchioplanes caeruleus TaxID=56438 RepID=UPI0016716D85|nr:hypothetical protein [Couchioplanes caeruleus]GGQ75898.1 hypothetical protein GCM10010166_52560 [Couchioplanes caeruleus subsp. azureus]